MFPAPVQIGGAATTNKVIKITHQNLHENITHTNGCGYPVPQAMESVC